MSLFEIVALLLSLAALFSYLNHRAFRLPTTIALMAMSLVLSVALIASGVFSPALVVFARDLLSRIDFNEALMKGMLGFLLFAGALHVDLDELRKQRWPIGVLATVGVTLSTVIVGLLCWWVLNTLFGLGVSWIYCLLFGALISPTDPIAVLGILKKAGAPRSLETKIMGESLFNDGVGVVIFLAIAGWIGFGHGALGSHAASGIGAGQVIELFLFEAVGGALVGLILGLLTFAMLRGVDNYQVEVLLSLALAAGGYALSHRLHVSGPIAAVVAGLLIGNQGRTLAMSERTREHLDTFWELIDEILNSVLFVMIGFEILVLRINSTFLLAGLLMIPVVLLARFISVGVPLALLRVRTRFTPHAVKILTWGGLRGGISVALALSIPRQLEGQVVAERDVLLWVTYSVVVFSIIVQGLTVGRLIRRLGLR